jgi:tRNA A37 threonylcarbamoyltransferase TsaD
MCKDFNITPLFPYSKKLYGDNAAMIGVTSYFKAQRNDFINSENTDIKPSFKIDQSAIEV